MTSSWIAPSPGPGGRRWFSGQIPDGTFDRGLGDRVASKATEWEAPFINASVRDTIVKLVLISFVVWLLISFFDINPKELLANFGETVQDIFALAVRCIEWSVKYVLLGAVMVVPIWLILLLINKARGKRNH